MLLACCAMAMADGDVARGLFWFVGGTDPDLYAQAKAEAASTRFRSTTVRTSRRCCIRRWKRESKRWWSRHWHGTRRDDVDAKPAMTRAFETPTTT